MGTRRVVVALGGVALLLGLLPSALTAQDKPPAPAPRAPRLIFVIDVETEEPLAGATVHDMITGNSMKTTPTGAVGLFVPDFVKREGAMIEVRLAGYQPSTRVFVDPMESEPLIFALLKLGSSLTRPIVRKRTDSTFFEVEVLDEAGAHMSEANIAVVQGRATGLDARLTDSTGLGTLSVPAVTGDVQITVQKIGYAPYRQFYRLSVADTIEAQIAMQRLAQQLPGITVTARGGIKRRVYHVDENEIANSSRNLAHGLDVVTKLRPTMFGDRLRGIPGCGTASIIYVNGRRIEEGPQNVSIPRLPPQRVSSRSARGPASRNARPMTPMPMGATDSVRAVLAGIKPEHIAEMTYVDCFETRIPGLRRNNAIYVVLKLGVEYDERLGSRLAGDTTTRK